MLNKRVPAVLRIKNSQNSAEIYIKDDRIGAAGKHSSKLIGSLKLGDVIAVKPKTGAHSPSFAMVFQLADGRSVVPTHSKTWFAYTPAMPTGRNDLPRHPST